MKRISKKILICSLTVATTTAAISWPIASSVLVTNHHNYGFIFEDQKFDSKDEIYHYVKNKSQKINTTQETNDSWWIIDDGKNKVYFADPESLRNYANQYITTRIVHSAYDLGQYINPKDGSLGTTADTQEIWEYINWDYNNKNEIQIFRGKDGTPFLTEQEAKNSYLSVSNGYYFNQIYFPSKEILKKYLYESYNSLFKTNSITVKAPNNQISAPLFKNDQNFEIKLNSFIKSNSYKFLEYNTNENKKIILNKSNYKNELSKIKINDLSYVRMYSNEGRQNYIIDLDKTDQYQLYGPYFYNGVLDIGNFSNKDSWKKIDEVNNNALTGNQINELIGNFFSLILGDFSIGDEVNKFFDIPLSIFDNRQNKEISLDEEYISSIKGFSNELYANIKKMVQDLNQGKRFNSFYKIPILYNYIIQNLVYFNADENLFNETIKYFSLIADYLQTIIEFIVPNEKFLFKKDNTKKFNVKEFFCIGNSEYNTNTTVEYFMNEIKQYDLLIASMITYSSAITNINAFSGVIPLNQQIYQALLDNSIITKKKLNDNLSTLNEIYKLFSKTSYNDFLEFLNNLSNFDNIKIAVANSESKELKILKTLLIRNNLIVNITDFILNKSLENNNYSILKTLNNKARMVYDLLQSNNSNNLTKWQAFIISYCIGSANVEFQINYNTILQDFYIWFSNNPISIFILNKYFYFK